MPATMTSREFFIYIITDELPRFERVFKALPVKKINYRPHKRSRNAQELVTSMILELITFPLFLQKGVFDFAKIKPPSYKNFNQLTKKFLAEFKKTVQIAKKMTDSKWNQKAKMLFNGKIEWETTRGIMAWGCLLDLIHHRGQLSTYIRPMGGKVPSIYGPSGDSIG